LPILILKLEEWAFEWVELIRNLYQLNDIRVSNLGNPEAFKESDEKLREAVLGMEERIEEELSQKKKDAECKSILKSMKNHWEGLTVFVDYPEVPMDNNLALCSGFQNPQDSAKSLVERTNFGFAA